MDYDYEGWLNTTARDLQMMAVLEANARVMIVCSLIGIVCSILTVHIIMKTTVQRSITDDVIIFLSISNFLFYVSSIAYHFTTKYMRLTKLEKCVVISFDGTFELCCHVAIFVLISNWIMKSPKFTVRLMYYTYLTSFTSLVITHTLCCMTWMMVNYYIALTVIFLILSAITMMVKEFNKWWKRRRNSPLRASTVFRMNIGRIFVYNWMISMPIFMFFYPHNHVVSLNNIVYLIPLHILIYLAKSNRNFKICLIHLLTFKSTNFDVDATVNFVENENDPTVEIRLDPNRNN